jgi:hypothetical protein
MVNCKGTAAAAEETRGAGDSRAEGRHAGVVARHAAMAMEAATARIKPET